MVGAMISPRSIHISCASPALAAPSLAQGKRPAKSGGAFRPPMRHCATGETIFPCFPCNCAVQHYVPEGQFFRCPPCPRQEFRHAWPSVCGQGRTHGPEEWAPCRGPADRSADFGPNPGALRMFVHVPHAACPRAAPLVVMLHGCRPRTAASYRDHGAGLERAGRPGLALCVLAPEQQNANNMGGCFNWFQPGDTDTARQSGEAASLRQMIARMLARTLIRLDARRVFITGLSAGGAMAWGDMLAAYPGKSSRAARLSLGLPYGAASNVPEALNSMRGAPSRSAAEWGAGGAPGLAPCRTMAARFRSWHGDADATVHAGQCRSIDRRNGRISIT